jgi:hypothetical protein
MAAKRRLGVLFPREVVEHVLERGERLARRHLRAAQINAVCVLPWCFAGMSMAIVPGVWPGSARGSPWYRRA